MLVDASHRIIATDGRGVLSERLSSNAGDRSSGYYSEGTGRLVAFHAAPRYETYRGLGWCGVIVQDG